MDAYCLMGHAIGGAKRFRSVTDVFRSRRAGLPAGQAGADDRAMVIAYGLWNYHLAQAS